MVFLPEIFFGPKLSSEAIFLPEIFFWSSDAWVKHPLCQRPPAYHARPRVAPPAPPPLSDIKAPYLYKLLLSCMIAVMKTCYHCKQEKGLDAFASRQGKTLSYCIHCYESLYGLLSDKKLKDAAARKKAQNKRIDKCRQYIKLLLESTPCMDCGIKDMIVLQFDHRDPKEKALDISDAISRGRLSKLQKEVEKCDVVCANCHIKRTAKSFGSWRLVSS